MQSFGDTLVSNPEVNLKFISLSNQTCQDRAALVDVNSNKTLFYLFTVSVNKYGGSCNAIDDPYARVCVRNKIKSMNVKVFNLMLGENERFLIQHGSCECKCGLNESVCNSKQRWNHDECWCKCKELNDWCSCKDDYIWNPNTCDYECKKAHKVNEYVVFKNCSCEKCLFDKLVLAYEDEILNATEASIDEKKLTCKKNNCLIHTISLVIIYLLLLVVISIICC